MCKGWNELLGGDAIWRPLYIKRFHFLDPREAVGVRAFKRLFRERLLDPHVRLRLFFDLCFCFWCTWLCACGAVVVVGGIVRPSINRRRTKN